MNIWLLRFTREKTVQAHVFEHPLPRLSIFFLCTHFFRNRISSLFLDSSFSLSVSAFLRSLSSVAGPVLPGQPAKHLWLPQLRQMFSRHRDPLHLKSEQDNQALIK